MGLGLEEFTDVSVMLRAGVYALLWAGEVVYIGQTKCLYRRIYAHRNLWERARAGKVVPDAMKFSSVKVYPCLPSDLRRLELELIERYQPKHNRLSKPSTRLSLASLGLPMVLVPRLRAEDRILRRL